MAAIRNIGRMTIGEMREQVKRGGRFVVYEYVISMLVITRRRASPVYYIPPGVPATRFHWPYSLVTLALGWWAFPWGPAFTVGAVRDNLQGGRDVTAKTIDIIFAAAKQSPLDRRSKSSSS